MLLWGADLTQVSQTQCVVEIRIVEYLSCFGPRPMWLTHVGRAIRGVKAPAAAPADGSDPRSARGAAQQRRKPGSLDQESQSMWGSVLWRDPCFSESIVRPLVEKRPPSLRCCVMGSIPAAALQPHSAGLAQLPVVEQPSQEVWAWRAWIQGWVYEVRAISRITVWVVSTGNDFVCTVTVRFIRTQLLH